ncbi:hypothetical protein [Mycoplasmoides alvi]|uniref:hypothetical protein n=1 Tax=Mycoplasmoides alvi TaxID=78580 RepID=UPI00051B8FB2|nr:hypothetical protein [Mycoplasmoides alvi]
MKIKQKIILITLCFFTMLLPLSAFLVSCNQINIVDQYASITLDSTLTGNLVALGFKPTCQSLYNSQTNIPSYISSLNINTEFGKQPSQSNAEFWLNRQPDLLYGFKYQKPENLSNYGFKYFIEDKNFYNPYSSTLFDNKVDKNAESIAKTWNFKDKLNYLGYKLSSIFNDIQTSALIDSKINLVFKQYENKINIFKNKFSFLKKHPTISFWGKNYGPNFVADVNNFSEYGPSTDYPGWLFDDLGFLPALPSVTDYKLKIFNDGGYNAIGWMPNVGSYNALGVQEAFKNSSDYVVVVLDSSVNLELMKDTIINTFKPILKQSSNLNSSKIIIVDQNFSLAPYNLLGIENAINILSEKILGFDVSKSINDQIIFERTNLKTLIFK